MSVSPETPKNKTEQSEFTKQTHPERPMFELKMPKQPRLKKSKSLKGSFIKYMAFFITLPLALSALTGLIMLLSHTTSQASDTSAMLANSRGVGLSTIIAEYISFLDTAANLDIVRLSAIEPESRAKAREFITAYAESKIGIYDILLTDNTGMIFASHTDSYSPAEFFRDTDALTTLAPLPTPVSEFYDNNTRFFIARPLTAIQGSTVLGYIVIKADTAPLVEYMFDITLNNTEIVATPRSPVSNETNESGFTPQSRSVLAIFDESGNIVSSEVEQGTLLTNSVNAYNAGTLFAEHGESQFESGRHFGTIKNVAGTRWRLISLEPMADATNTAWGVFSIALAIAGGLGIINLIFILVRFKNLFAPLNLLTDTIRKAHPSNYDEPLFEPIKAETLQTTLGKFAQNVKSSEYIEYGEIINDLNLILQKAETTYKEIKAKEPLEKDFKLEFDYLTDLYSRNTFEKLLKKTLEFSPNPEKATVLFVTLNNFKTIDKQFGHKIGNEIIRFTAEHLKNAIETTSSALKESQTGFAGRYSGSEFALCIPERPSNVDDVDSIELLCKELIVKLYEGYFCVSVATQINIPISIGVSSVKGTNCPKQLIAEADKALYFAQKNNKQGKPNYHIYTS
ncbi:MAG: GGDEF domain-containing protein [Oscillospiraceae bacterium]|nr:GGDEF domain-containing protein [Oscillospiraceae bacterium]